MERSRSTSERTIDAGSAPLVTWLTLALSSGSFSTCQALSIGSDA